MASSAPLAPREFPLRPGAAGYRPPECTFPAGEWQVLAAEWHPVAQAEDVRDRPVGARLLDERLVLFRTSAGITVASDLCIHRGSSLSRGSMAGDEIVCAYHGFRYAADGRCTLVPSQGPGRPISSRLCLSVYRAEVRYGLVWVCLAPGPAGRIPDLPELESPEFRIVRLPPAVWRASAARHVENFNDNAHVGFVHAATFGNPAQTQVGEIDLSEEDGVLVQRFRYARVDRDTLGADAVVRERPVENRIHLPFTSHLRMTKGPGQVWSVYDFVSPVSSRESRIFMLVARNHDLELPVDEVRDFQHLVNEEDRPIVEDQHPEYLPLDLAEEQHVGADQISVAYRRALRAMGLGPGFSA